MKLVSYASGGSLCPGVVYDDRVFDIPSLVARSAGLWDRPCGSMREFLASFADDLPDVARALEDLAAKHPECDRGAVPSLRLGPPVPDPAKVLCVGLNYLSHVAETGRQLPEHPDIFVKFASSLVGPDDELALSSVSCKLDYEGELGVVIGKLCRNVSPENALEYVAGAMVVNDVTARDLQYNGTQWTPGKAVDGSTPCGPALVTLDSLGDLAGLTLSTRVNGREVQRAGTDRMIFPVPVIVSYISRFLELAPGDVISTGTPEGIGSKRTPPSFLSSGDVVEVEITEVGLIRNTVR